MQESMRRTAGPKVNAHSKGIKVLVEQHVKDKMEGWCNAANSEVSGWFLVRNEKGLFYVYDVFLPNQNGSPGYTLIDGYATDRLTKWLVKTGREVDAYDNMRGWWHTHYKGSTFWSGTDDDQAQKNALQYETWSLSIVINQAGNWLARVDVVDPIPVMITDLPITFVANTKPHSKRNYARDVRRWVNPFPARKEVTTVNVVRNSPVVEPVRMYVARTQQKDMSWPATSSHSVSESNYINYGGVLIPKQTFDKILACPCGDMTCIDCSDAVRQIKKGVEADLQLEDQREELVDRRFHA